MPERAKVDGIPAAAGRIEHGVDGADPPGERVTQRCRHTQHARWIRQPDGEHHSAGAETNWP
jgi:hypothetical protein